MLGSGNWNNCPHQSLIKCLPVGELRMGVPSHLCALMQWEWVRLSVNSNCSHQSKINNQCAWACLATRVRWCKLCETTVLAVTWVRLVRLSVNFDQSLQLLRPRWNGRHTEGLLMCERLSVVVGNAALCCVAGRLPVVGQTFLVNGCSWVLVFPAYWPSCTLTHAADMIKWRYIYLRSFVLLHPSSWVGCKGGP